MVETLLYLSIGGVKLGMERKYIGLIGEGYAHRKGRAEWVFGTSTPLTWLCWRSKHGNFSMKHTHYFTACTKPAIFPHALLWMRNWEQANR